METPTVKVVCPICKITTRGIQKPNGAVVATCRKCKASVYQIRKGKKLLTSAKPYKTKYVLA